MDIEVVDIEIMDIEIEIMDIHKFKDINTVKDINTANCHQMLHDKSIFPNLASLEDPTCYICFEKCSNSPKGEAAVKLPCGHVFGLSCLSEWTNRMETLKDCTCPLCRQLYGTDSDHLLVSWLTCSKRIHNMMQEFSGAQERVFDCKTWKQLNAAISAAFVLIQQQAGPRSAFHETGADRELVELVKGNLRFSSRCCKRRNSVFEYIRSMVGRQMATYEAVLVRLGVGDLLPEPIQTGMSKKELLQDWW